MNKWLRYTLDLIKRVLKLEQKAHRKIHENYEVVTANIMNELSKLYEKVDKGQGLKMEDVQRFNDLQRFQSRVVAQSHLLSKKNKRVVHTLLEDTYDLSYSHMSYVVETEARKTLDNATPDLPAILKQVHDNPIYGLHLESSMEKDRQIIVRDINGAIDRGLRAGETYSGIAKRIRKVFDSSVYRSMVIARTETHRVRERAVQESAMNAHRQGIKMEKTWRNMGDERVRETKKADHVEMEGQTVPVDKPFVTSQGYQGMSPGSFMVAEMDIQCRCYSSRRIKGLEQQEPEKAGKATFEDWQKMKRG